MSTEKNFQVGDIVSVDWFNHEVWTGTATIIDDPAAPDQYSVRMHHSKMRGAFPVSALTLVTRREDAPDHDSREGRIALIQDQINQAQERVNELVRERQSLLSPIYDAKSGDMFVSEGELFMVDHTIGNTLHLKGPALWHLRTTGDASVWAYIDHWKEKGYTTFEPVKSLNENFGVVVRRAAKWKA